MSINQARKRASSASRKKTRRHPYVVAERSAEPYVVDKTKFPDSKVRAVIDFMNANLHRRIRLSELANVVHLSPSHLSHLFKTQTGLSPGEYLRRLRMEKPVTFSQPVR